ncbi:MAG: lysophospholipid acyltransferase family protein [Pseudomonadota bacterium]
MSRTVDDLSDEIAARRRADPAPLRALWPLANLLQFVYTLLWTAGCISAALVVRALRGNADAPLRMASRLWAPGLLRGAGARLDVRGAEAIDWSKPYVVVANHQSMIDICALFRAVPVPLRFVMKQEMSRVPFLGAYVRAMGMVFVDRAGQGAGEAMQRDTVALLRDGACVLVFPEGTRSRDGRIGAFKGGAFRAAIEAGVDVLPVAIAGAGAVLPPTGLFRVRPGRIALRIGAPLPATGIDRHALAREARATVIALLETAERER